jgi:hypothetical protein
MNEEARMTNDDLTPNAESTNENHSGQQLFRDSLIWASLVIRHLFIRHSRQTRHGPVI